MNRFWILTKTLLKNNLNLSWKTKKGRRNLLLYLVLLILMSPLGFLLGNIAYQGFSFGLTGLTIELYILGQCLINLLMIGITFPPVFYFSDDNALLLTLPVRPFDIVASKTAVVLSSQIYTLLLGVVPLVIAYALSPVFSWTGLLFLILGEFLSLLILFAALGIIWIVVFAWFPKAVNKDRFTLISGIAAMTVSIGISVIIQANPEKALPEGIEQIENLAAALKGSLGFAGILFPQAAWSAQAVEGNVVSLLLLAVLCVFTFLLFGFTAQKWYLSSATAASASVSKQKKSRKSEMAASPAWKSSLKNEIRILLRTPAFLFNIVIAAFIVPLMFMFVFGLQLNTIRPVLEELFFRNGHFEIPGLPLWALALTLGLVFAVFLAGSSSCSCTAISRMGERGVSWMKTVPMSLSSQVLIKMVPGIFLSIITTQLGVIVLHMLVPYPYWADLVFLAANVAGSILINEIGILTDLLHPKLIWDSETAAMKNNVNTLIDLGISLLIILLSVVLYLILPFEWASAASLLWILAADFLLWKLIEKKASFWMMKMH